MSRAAVGTVLASLALLTCAAPERGPEPIVSDFIDASRWEARPSEGVALDISTDTVNGTPALRLDFDFRGGGGYAVARRDLDLSFPENYELRFRIRGDAPPNNLEFKLEDPSGENVWWVNQRDFSFPDTFTDVRLRKRHITFAWGPAGGGDIQQAAAVEFAITAGSGGSGTVWLDDLALIPLDPPQPWTGEATVRASESVRGRPARSVLDGDTTTAWAVPLEEPRRLTIDFEQTRELGGLVLDWAPDSAATDYDVALSVDEDEWITVREVRGSDGGRDWIYAPDSDARYIRIELLAGAPVVALREVTVQPLEWSATRNDFFSAIARDAPVGHHPRYLLGEASYWTVVGVDADREEALLDADGSLEAGLAGFSIEPFLRTEAGTLLTWADGTNTPSLVDGDLPLPRVRRLADSLALTITVLAAGDTGASSAWARYSVENLTDRARSATLYLAVRPYQVNPSYQFLNVTGGVVRIDSLRANAGVATVNGNGRVVSLDVPDGFGATTFDTGGIVPFLVRGELPDEPSANDPFGHASGAFAYELSLPPAGTTDVHIAVPLHANAPVPPAARGGAAARAAFDLRFDNAREFWRAQTSTLTMEVAGQGGEAAATLRTVVSHILINRDGPAIQPGSRSYQRSWIRDGSLTSAALLRVGRADVVRDFIDWFAPYQFENGKVPCCVDRTGAGPVPENDSHGQLIFLIAEYFRHTGDSALVRRHWAHIRAAVEYMDSLRNSRMTDEYRTDERRAYFGLLPESISHEGYSARPVHSYWDDLFALRGLRDAAFLADTLGFEEAADWARLRGDFERTFEESMRATMAMHGIGYVPGSVELGDFDPTSTTVALAPTDARSLLPDSALERTFERYWQDFVERRDSGRDWDVYTPYELRNVGAFIRLGWKDRALEALDFFLADRRPAAWHQWSEVVPGDTASTVFIGDMPHTWVGSDFIRAFLDFFAWEDESEQALVIGAGVPPEWLGEEGVRIENLSTWWGDLDLTIAPVGDGIEVVIGGEMKTPPGGVRVHSPLETTIVAATIDGQPVPDENGVVRADTVPARIIFRHAPR